MPLEEVYKRRLPLYGPLNIEKTRTFLKEAKITFNECFNSPFPYQVSLQNFELLHILGRGAFGKVILVRYKVFEQSFYAMKALSKGNIVKNKTLHRALNEKLILQSLNSPFCVRLEYFSHDNSYLYFFLPFICGGEMFTHLQKVKQFEENLSKFYAAQVVLGFEYLHYLDLVYRDLKPENLLIDHHGYLKITDFGFTKKVSTRTYSFCGTPDYIPPEMILGKSHGKAVDWWALGVLIYEMNAGHPPFVAREQMEVFGKVIKGHYMMPKKFSKDLQDIIKRLLQIDVTRRIGTLKGGVEEIKRHGWFRRIDWLPLLNRRVAAPFVPKNAQIVSNEQFPDLKPCSTWKISETNHYGELFQEF